MGSQLGFIFNANDCIGCKSCEIACKNENQLEAEVDWRRVTMLSDKFFISVSCNHCASPECFRVCPENAFTKRADGIVLIDSNLCSACGKCKEACPIDAPQYNMQTHKFNKCQMCYQRQDQGKLPACVEACTTGALRTADLERSYPNLVSTLKGFENMGITQPSIAFQPIKGEKQRYFIKE